MQSISIAELLLVIYVIVDDWYLVQGYSFLQGKPGRKPCFRDSEVITLMLAQDFIPYPGENQYIGYIKANYSDLFPDLITQSQFNRRARNLRLLVEKMRRYWLRELNMLTQVDLLLDTKPIPVMGYKRSKRCSDFAGSADYGVCTSRKMKYYGYKLVSLCTLEGIPVVYELVPANTVSAWQPKVSCMPCEAAISTQTKVSSEKIGRKESISIHVIAFTQPSELIKLSKIQFLSIAG